MENRSSRFAELVEKIERLRDPADGCPWDLAQDHRSLRPYMLEEAYEAIAAIDSGQPAAVVDELGDVLLQVVLHAQIASEKDEFTIADVIDGLIRKLIRRHPHVFGDASNDLSDIVQRWNDIKKGETSHKSIPPPLIEARKLVDAAQRKRVPLALMGTPSKEEEAGLGILVAIARSWESGFEPELALRKAMDSVQRLQEKDAQ